MSGTSDERWFRTSSGRQVLLEVVHIRKFDYGFLEGRPSLIRQRVLAELPAQVRRVIPGDTTILVQNCEGPEDQYPALVYICEFTCFEPVSSGDCSGLIIVWFAEDMRRPIPEFVGARIANVEWERYAVDGKW